MFNARGKKDYFREEKWHCRRQFVKRNKTYTEMREEMSAMIHEAVNLSHPSKVTAW